MKTPSLALLNEIGLRSPADRALLAAYWLKIATVSSPSVTITPEIPAIAARPEVIAQTAKLARPATVAISANATNPAHPFGTLFLNSPAFPAGAALPAFPPKPASAAVIGVSAIVGSPKIPAVVSPKIDALKGWEDAIQINKSPSFIDIIAYLPYASSPLLVGASTNGSEAINQMTQSSLIPGKWMGVKSSNAPGVETSIPLTVEQYFYKQAQALVASNSSGATITNSTKLVNGVVTSCKLILLSLSVSDYDLEIEDIQLEKVGIIRPLSPLGTIETQFPHPSPNKDYPTEQAWLDYVASTPTASPERSFVSWVASNYPSGYNFFTFAAADSFYNPAIHQLDGGAMGEWYFYHFNLR